MNLHPGWMIVAVGLVIALAGLVWIFAPGVPLGRLPGDIHIETSHTRIYFPIVTCLVISLLLTAILSIIRWLS